MSATSKINFAKLIREHGEKWQRIACSSIPADRPRVEQSVAEFYQTQLKCEAPRCIWIDSPRQVNRADKSTESEERMFHTRDLIRAKLGAATQAGRAYFQQVPPERLAELENAIGQIRHPLNLHQRGRWSWLWHHTKTPDDGEHDDLTGIAFIDFLMKIPLDELRPSEEFIRLMLALKPWIFVIASCNGLWYRKGAIILMDTPEILRIDEQGRLHCEDGPALRWRDGVQYHFLHGIRVPEQYVFAKPDEISLADVVEERNAEVRLTLINKIGFSRLLGTVRHWTISEANGNRLLEFRVKGTQLVRGLHVKWRDKTGEKETIIPVPSRRSYFGEDCPADIDDCEQVRRWTLGWPKDALAVAET
ncbi:MAG: DUF6745 domain-containing protein [Candidatus Binatia bacterium]